MGVPQDQDGDVRVLAADVAQARYGLLFGEHVLLRVGDGAVAYGDRALARAEREPGEEPARVGVERGPGPAEAGPGQRHAALVAESAEDDQVVIACDAQAR